MFIGSWIINLIISLIAFFFVFIGSLLTNSFQTSLKRGAITFLSFFIITYFFRWVWMVASKDNIKSPEKNSTIIIDSNLEGKDRNSKTELSNEEVKLASQYVKDLIND